jgi:hypothetical protein
VIAVDYESFVWEKKGMKKDKWSEASCHRKGAKANLSQPLDG